jgi:hypothetical protein
MFTLTLPYARMLGEESPVWSFVFSVMCPFDFSISQKRDGVSDPKIINRK